MIGFGKKNEEERMMDKQMAFQRELSREQNAISTVDPNDAPYLAQREGMQDLTRWQQDLDDDINYLKYDFKNMIKTDDGWKHMTKMIYVRDSNGQLIEKEVKLNPIMNDEGIYRVISVVKRYLTRNLMMSNYSEIIICRIMRGLVQDLVIHLGLNWRKYEMNYSDLSLVVRMVKDSVEPTLYRCLNNGERRYLNTINKRIETMNLSDQEKKKSGFTEMLKGGVR
jgi:hypothetical protein